MNEENKNNTSSHPIGATVPGNWIRRMGNNTQPGDNRNANCPNPKSKPRTAIAIPEPQNETGGMK
ncbi:MAG: hypothetical protein ACP5G4_09070 [bacterium]